MPSYPPTLIIVIQFFFSGLPHSYLLPLQRIQNTAARHVTLSRKSEHITTNLRSLHWLPIHHRITFKVLLLTYKIIHGQAPKYLSDLISLRCSSSLRPLRSSSTLQLTLGPRTVTRYGDRAFSVIAPNLWICSCLQSHPGAHNNMWLWSDIRSYLVSSLLYFRPLSRYALYCYIMAENHVADNQTCLLCVVHCAVCACIKHDCLRVGLGYTLKFLFKNRKKFKTNCKISGSPGSKTDGTHMGFIWAGWGPYAPHGNHVGPIWAIRIVMHTRSTHMGPTWVPYVLFWAICPELHIYGLHIEPMWVIQLAKSINALGRWNSADGSQVHPRCVLMIW